MVYLDGVDALSHRFVGRGARGRGDRAGVPRGGCVPRAPGRGGRPPTWIVVASDHGFYPPDAGVSEDPAELAGPATAWHRPYGIVAAIEARELLPSARRPPRRGDRRQRHTARRRADHPARRRPAVEPRDAGTRGRRASARERRRDRSRACDRSSPPRGRAGQAPRPPSRRRAARGCSHSATSGERPARSAGSTWARSSTARASYAAERELRRRSTHSRRTSRPLLWLARRAQRSAAGREALQSSTRAALGSPRATRSSRRSRRPAAGSLRRDAAAARRAAEAPRRRGHVARAILAAEGSPSRRRASCGWHCAADPDDGALERLLELLAPPAAPRRPAHPAPRRPAPDSARPRGPPGKALLARATRRRGAHAHARAAAGTGSRPCASSSPASIWRATRTTRGALAPGSGLARAQRAARRRRPAGRRWEEAVRHYREALAAGPIDNDVLNALGWALYSRAATRGDRALRPLARARRRPARDPGAAGDARLVSRREAARDGAACAPRSSGPGLRAGGARSSSWRGRAAAAALAAIVRAPARAGPDTRPARRAARDDRHAARGPARLRTATRPPRRRRSTRSPGAASASRPRSRTRRSRRRRTPRSSPACCRRGTASATTAPSCCPAEPTTLAEAFRERRLLDRRLRLRLPARPPLRLRARFRHLRRPSAAGRRRAARAPTSSARPRTTPLRSRLDRSGAPRRGSPGSTTSTRTRPTSRPPTYGALRREPYDGEIASVERELGALLRRPAATRTRADARARHRGSRREPGRARRGDARRVRLRRDAARAVDHGRPGSAARAASRTRSHAGSTSRPRSSTTRGSRFRPASTAARCDRRCERAEAMADAPAYAESLFCSLNLGWAPLHAMRSARYKLIEAPRPELYDVGRRSRRAAGRRGRAGPRGGDAAGRAAAGARDAAARRAAHARCRGTRAAAGARLRLGERAEPADGARSEGRHRARRTARARPGGSAARIRRSRSGSSRPSWPSSPRAARAPPSGDRVPVAGATTRPSRTSACSSRGRRSRRGPDRPRRVAPSRRTSRGGPRRPRPRRGGGSPGARAAALRARTLRAMGRDADARTALERALALDPANAEARRGLAELALGPRRPARRRRCSQLDRGRRPDRRAGAREAGRRAHARGTRSRGARALRAGGGPRPAQRRGAARSRRGARPRADARPKRFPTSRRRSRRAAARPRRSTASAWRASRRATRRARRAPSATRSRSIRASPWLADLLRRVSGGRR